MTVKLLTEHHLEFVSLKGGCRGLSESTHVKIPHCLKSHVTAYILIIDEGPPHDTATKRHKTLTPTRQQEYNNIKAVTS